MTSHSSQACLLLQNPAFMLPFANTQNRWQDVFEKNIKRCFLPSTSGKSFLAPCEWNPRTCRVSMANSYLSEIRKAPYFSFPRSIFAPVLGLTENIR